MQSTVQDILNELIKLDPELQSKETELRRIVEAMLENRPESMLDANFQKELRQKIDTELRTMKQEKKPVSSPLAWILPFLLGWAVFASLLIFLPIDPKSTPPTDRSATIAFNLSIKKSDDRAFGTITPSASPAPSGLGWGNSESAKRMAPMASDSMIAPYEPILYRYVYSGSGLDLKDPKLAVLRKDNQRFQSSELASLLQGFHISGFDIGAFTNLRLDNMTLSEDTQYGHQISIDLNAGTISMYRDYAKWPQSTCQTDECFQKERPSLSDMPTKENIVAIASDFIAKYQIDTAHYGEPVVNEDWRADYDRASDKSTVYIPDTVSLTYPLVIDGKSVYEEYGAPKGLMLSIDIRSKRVSDFSGMEKLDFLASDYAADTDFEHMKSLAEKGGRYTPSYQTGSGKTVDVSLGTPTLSYVHLSEYKDGKSSEYLVPALVFPVTSTPKEGEYFQKTVTIPLVKDFQTTQNSGIMPMMKPEVR